MGASKYCRIAIGQDSRSDKVHPDFKVILIADYIKVKDEDTQIYDPPLLNRFEKQYLNDEEILDEDSTKMKKQLQYYL
jgi:hypothetical protein